MNKTILYVVIAVVIVVGGFFALNSYIYREKQADFTPGETVAAKGEVLAVDREQITFDGPFVLTLKSDKNELITIEVPSMGLPLCAAYQNNNIADVYAIEAGANIEVRGIVGENGSVVPCESPDHYLRVLSPMVADYKDAEFTIDGKRVKLENGVAETETTPGSASKTVTKYFGNEAKGDINGDGITDLAFLLTQETGGSGTFYYLVAALQGADNRYLGTNAISLGDRIAPQTTEYRDGGVIVNYAIRKAGEPMTVQPSIGVSKYFKILGGELSEVELGFEGEADPDRMYLTMKTWDWIRATYNDGRIVTPKQPSRFTVTFKNDGTFGATTDCNSVGGKYAASEEGAISFSNMISTKMYCEGSQESDFTKLLGDASGYTFTSKGELILDLKLDSGSVTFR